MNLIGLRLVVWKSWVLRGGLDTVIGLTPTPNRAGPYTFPLASSLLAIYAKSERYRPHNIEMIYILPMLGHSPVRNGLQWKSWAGSTFSRLTSAAVPADAAEKLEALRSRRLKQRRLVCEHNSSEGFVWAVAGLGISWYAGVTRSSWSWDKRVYCLGTLQMQRPMADTSDWYESANDTRTRTYQH